MRGADETGHDSHSRHAGENRLEDLIPIAVVIAAGCESCAGRMVERALREGSTPRGIERSLRIVEHQRSLDCFRSAVGPDVVARMEKPLEAARKTLAAARPAGDDCCGRRVG